MKVSIITPVFNSEKYIKDTIVSVLNQSFDDWEYILIDDNSPDNSVTIIHSFCNKDDRIKLIKLKQNKGAAIARNTGIKAAKGKYIAFLDSDDKWHIDKLKIQIGFMENNNCNFTFTNYYILNENQSEEIPFKALLNKVKYRSIIKFNYIACSTVIFNQEVLGKHYMPNIRSRQDWGLWINLIKENKVALRVNEYLMYYLIRQNSISSSKMKLIKYHWYIYKSFLNFGLFKSIIYFTNNIFLHVKNIKR